MDDYLSALLHEVVKMDDRFEGTLFKSGSTREGAKTGFPDEFDYMWQMSRFTDEWLDVESFNVSELDGFRLLKVSSDSKLGENFREFVGPSGYLDCNMIHRYFHKLIFTAMFKIFKSYTSNIFFSFRLYQNATYFNKNDFSEKVALPTHSVIWRGSTYKYIEISFDVIPSICFQLRPSDSMIETSSLMSESDMRRTGIHLITKKPRLTVAHPEEPPWWQQAANQPIRYAWRVSFSKLELELMHRIPEVFRDGYVLAKSFREDPLGCAVAKLVSADDDSVAEWVAYSGITPNSGETEQDIQNDDEENDDDEDAGDAHEIDESETQANIPAQFSSASGSVDEEQYTEDDWINAHSVVPSYWLKMIFLREVDRLLLQGKELTPTQVALLLYERL